MNKWILLLPMFLILLVPNISAQPQMHGPDTNVVITCSEDTYSADWDGIIDIYCDIENNDVAAKALQVGGIFDDYFDGENTYDVELLEVNVDGSPINFGLTHLPPQAGHVRSRVLSVQVVQILGGDSKQLHMKAKVPVPSQGKFDVLFGNPDLNGYWLDPWWSTHYAYKRCYNVTATANLNGDTWDNPWGYPFNLTLNTNSLIATNKMQSDCDDVRLIENDTNPTLVPKYFMRDCDQSVSEVWGLWNFTADQQYEFCLYYGNTTAPSNYSDRNDIVFSFEDFDKFAFDWADYYNITSWQPARNPPYAIVSDGKLKFYVGSNGGNSGFGVIRSDTYFNISKTGLLVDFEYWYSSTSGTGGWTTQIVQATDQTQPQIYQGTNNYATCRYGSYGNCTSPLILNYIGTQWDLGGYGSNSTNTATSGEVMDFRWYNYSNYYSSASQWNRWMFEFNPANCSDNYEDTPRNSCMVIYGDYGGQPYTDPILRYNWSYYYGPTTNPINAEPNPNPSKPSFPYNATLYYSSSIGAGGSNQLQGQYEFWFARPFQEGEPLATAGAEIPLNDADLIVDFTDPTPANATTRINANSVIINVSSNKTIEWCKLEWDGSNYTMTTNDLYCYLDKTITGTHTYKVWVEDLWGWQNDTETRTLTKIPSTALLGVNFNVSDFTFASSDYITGINVSFNTSQTESLIVMTSMNVKKQTGTEQNEIWARAIVDGNVVLEERIRTVSDIFDEGSTGISAFPFNVSVGEHYIQIDFKRTGDGFVEVSDIDINMGKFNTYIGGVVSGDINSGNFTHNETSFIPALNFTINKTSASPTFMSFKISVSSDGANQVTYAFQNLDNTSQISPYGGRYLASPTDVGSMAGTFIIDLPAGENNLTILAKNSNEVTTSVNFTGIFFDLLDDGNNNVEYFQTTNPNTNDTESINITDEWTLLASATKTVVIGDSYFMGIYTTANSPLGNQTISYKINATGVTCESKKERYLSNSNDYGLIFIYFICDGLSNQTAYDFELWGKAESGMWFDQYDESFAGFEVQSFDITEGNIPPIAGAITSPANTSTVSGTITIAWEEFVDQNDNFDDYNVTLRNSDGSYNRVITGSTTDLNTTFDTTAVSDGDYRARVEGCDLLGLCSYTENYFTIDNTGPIITIASPEATTYLAENVEQTSVTIALNVSADESVTLWQYSLDGGANQTFTPNTTITVALGSHEIVVYATDLYDNVGSEAVTFTFAQPAFFGLVTGLPSPFGLLGAVILAGGWILTALTLFLRKELFGVKFNVGQILIVTMITLVITIQLVAFLIMGG